MCDPLTLGALAIGAAGTAANSIGQAKAQKKQEAEYNQWAQNQKKIRAQENVRQEELRGKAEESQAERRRGHLGREPGDAAAGRKRPAGH